MPKKKSSTSSPRSQALLQEKKRAAKILREAGLFKRKTGRVTNKYLKESSYFRSLRREFADVIAGTARAAKIPKFKLPEFKGAGYRVKQRRVIVPKAVKRPVPTAPPPPRGPRGPRPPAGGGGGDDHSINECLEKVRDWWYTNANPKLGDLDTRWLEVEAHARRNPNMFRKIVNASNTEGQNYLNGKPPIRGLYPRAPWFKNNAEELYYYHPSESSSNVTGGLMPRC